MLILERGYMESIMINDDIRITVLAITQGSVKLGIDAPREIPVHRLEVYEKVMASEQEK